MQCTPYSIYHAVIILLTISTCSFSLPFHTVSEFSLFQPALIRVTHFDGVAGYQSETPSNNVRHQVISSDSTVNVQNFTQWQMLDYCQQLDANRRAADVPLNFSDVKDGTKSVYTVEFDQNKGLQLPSNASRLCLFSQRVFDEVKNMRSFDVPLAHVFRSHLMMEFLPLLLKQLHLSPSKIMTETPNKSSILSNSSKNSRMMAEIDGDEASTNHSDNNPINFSPYAAKFRYDDQTAFSDASRSSSSPFEFGFFPIESPEEELLPSSKSLLQLTAIDYAGIALVALSCTIAVSVGVGGK